MKTLFATVTTSIILLGFSACKKSYNCTCTNKSGTVILTIKYDKSKRKNAETDCTTYVPFRTGDSTATCRLQ
ncbi:MAG: hypothetical protein JST82_01905 [Bacteroidetes bacterium]|nr:hypothetical protein [Bacteroidota bacterium]